MSKAVLVVDDDPLLRRSLAFNLEQAGYQATTADSAEQALEMAASNRPDLVLMDVGLPGMDGLQALRLLRDRGIPVIMVTSRRRELDEILGLELGADDYITKPFDPDVLLARVRSVLRRAQSETAPIETAPSHLEVGDLIVDPGGRTVTVAGRVVPLSPREFHLLTSLAREAGRVVSTERLLDLVWGEGFAGEPQVLYVHMRWLREKIEEDTTAPRRLLTVRGVGYKLVDPAASL